MKPTHPYGKKTVFFLRCLLILAVLLCAESAGNGEKGLECHAKDDTIVCEFTIEKKDNQDVTLDLEYCDDDFCVKTTVKKESIRKEDPAVASGFRDDPAIEKHHGKNVDAVLQRRPKTEPSTLEEILAHADWYSDLGKAYRKHGMVDSAGMDWKSMDVDACIEAFQHAVATYNQALQKGAPLDTRLSLAVAEAYLAESLLFHLSNAQPTKALKHFLNAEENYRTVLESGILKGHEYADWEINWADTLGHSASLLIENADGADGQDPTRESVLDVSRFLESAEKAEKMLNNAIRVYRKAMETAVGDDTPFYQLRLANTLHSLGTARMLTSTVGRAIAVMEEGRDIFETLIPQIKQNSVDRNDALAGMAELLISLSDAYLQAGNYVRAKIRYKDAMEWYKEHNLVPAEVPTVRSDELLVELEEQLGEYHASLVGGGEIPIPDDYRAPGEPLYEPDNRYEADLHSAIGAIELSHGQIELSMTHFVKAIDMYEELGGEDRAIADTKLNMAMALFRLREFDQSAQTHCEALDIYRKVVGDGKNPLLADALVNKGSGDEPANAENENAFRAQLVNLDALQQGLANLTSKDEL